MTLNPIRFALCAIVALTLTQNGFAQPQTKFPKLDEKKIVELLKGEPEETVKLALYYLKIAEDTTDPKRYIELFNRVELSQYPRGFGGLSPQMVYVLNTLIIHGGEDAIAVIPNVVKLISETSFNHSPAFGKNPKRPKEFTSAYEILYSAEKKSLPAILAQLEMGCCNEGLMICGTSIALDEYTSIPVHEPVFLGSGPRTRPSQDINWKWDEKYLALLKKAKTDEDKFHAALLCGEPLIAAQKDLQKLIESPTAATDLRIKALRVYSYRAKTEDAEKYLTSLMGDKQDGKINLACKGLLARIKAGEECDKARQNALNKEREDKR